MCVAPPCRVEAGLDSLEFLDSAFASFCILSLLSSCSSRSSCSLVFANRLISFFWARMLLKAHSRLEDIPVCTGYWIACGFEAETTGSEREEGIAGQSSG